MRMTKREGSVAAIGRKYELLLPFLNERTLRLWAATEALALGRGGIAFVARGTGMSRTTVYAGIRDLETDPESESAGPRPERMRRRGGGRKRVILKDPALLEDLEKLVEPMTRGDPESPLRWTCKSTTNLARELRGMDHQVSQRTVCDLLTELGYSLQSNRKTNEGARHPDRNAQFLHISEKTRELLSRRQPVVSVDTKKKELIGPYKNAGREYHKKGEPEKVNVYDFVDRELGKVSPYGVYDVGKNQGWVSVGIDHDTAQFAVESIRRWWQEMGRAMYPNAVELLVTADCGGSNGYRVRLWKLQLQRLATELGMTIHVCHFPPGTSKWNKIEHRMFCHITKNWRGRPLTSREVVVNLISATKTNQGLEIRAALDENHYAKGIKIADADMRRIAISRDEFHGEWNYMIRPFDAM